MNHFRRQLLTVAVMSFLLPGLARACSCSGPRPIPFNLLLKESDAIFVGTVIDVPDLDPKAPQSEQAGYTFTVSEAFAGTSSGGEAVVYIALRGMCDSPHFEKGEQYLVYANRAPDGTLYAALCSRTQLASRAEILLRQLRAAKGKKAIASLYGVLRRTQQPYIGIWRQDYEQPVANTTVRLRLKTGKVFTTKTDDSGGYAFYNLPQGVYEVAADLPQHLVIAQTILSDPPPPVILPAQSCYQYDIEAMPQSRITGHLIGPDGSFVQGGVELFAEDIYAQQKEKKGWWEFADGEKGFRFNRVAPGNYLLVFNVSNMTNPDAPYPRTFYPGTSDLARASRIHVTESDWEINADMHLSGGEETTEITVRLEWIGNYKAGKDDIVLLSLQSDAGDHPFARNLGNGVFSFKILRRATYSVQGTAFCQSHERVDTNTVSIKGSEVFTAPLVLRFSENACVK
jgi:hypothetical protein